MAPRLLSARPGDLALIGACGVMLGLANVIGGQTHGVWLTTLRERHGLPLSLLALGPTVFYLGAGLAGLLVGRAVDRDWTRGVLVLGVGALMAGSLLLGSSTSLWQASTGFACLGIGFACLGQIPLGKLLARWFHGPARRQAMGLASLGPSLGASLIWLMVLVLEQSTPHVAGALLATVTAALMLPLLPVLTHAPPTLAAQESPDAVPRAAAGRPLHPWTLREARQHLAWWALALALICVMGAQISYIIHAVPLYAETFGLPMAGAIWMGSGVCGVGARLAYAHLPLHQPLYILASHIYFLEALGFALLAVGRPAGVLLLAAGLLGMTISLTVTLEPHLASETFEQTGAYGVLYGRLYLWTRVAAAGGAGGSGWLRTATGSYTLPLLLMALLLLVAALSVRWATPLVSRAAVPGGRR